VPKSTQAVVEALKTVLARARSGQDIEIGCLGGHGRTGTALACLAVLTGHPALDAAAWVRSSYCAKAVETPQQEAFIAALFSS
jgi:protein-tyrosine phosphatase